eukprot:2220601-Rhodomonas_salina.1
MNLLRVSQFSQRVWIQQEVRRQTPGRVDGNLRAYQLPNRSCNASLFPRLSLVLTRPVRLQVAAAAGRAERDPSLALPAAPALHARRVAADRAGASLPIGLRDARH